MQEREDDGFRQIVRYDEVECTLRHSIGKQIQRSNKSLGCPPPQVNDNELVEIMHAHVTGEVDIS
jgi:hypothetical protein